MKKIYETMKWFLLVVPIVAGLQARTETGPDLRSCPVVLEKRSDGQTAQRLGRDCCGRCRPLRYYYNSYYYRYRTRRWAGYWGYPRYRNRGWAQVYTSDPGLFGRGYLNERHGWGW